jgi:hypothetical protein
MDQSDTNNLSYKQNNIWSINSLIILPNYFL